MSVWQMKTQDIFRILSTDKPPKARKRPSPNVQHENQCRTQHTGILQSNNNNISSSNRELAGVAGFRVNVVAEIMDNEETFEVRAVPMAVSAGLGCRGAVAAAEAVVRGSTMVRLTMVWAVL